METGHLIVGKFSHTIEEIDRAVDKATRLSEVREQQVKKPVIFGRCIPVNAQCGSRYYFEASIKIKRDDLKIFGNLDLSDWEIKSTWLQPTADFDSHKIVTIPKDFDYRRFVEDSEYRNSLVTSTDGNIENTAAPYWTIINGHPVFTKVASFKDPNVRFFRFIKGYKRRPYYDIRAKFKACKRMNEGLCNIVFATTHRRQRRVLIKDDYGMLIHKYQRKCSIVSAKWYFKPNKNHSKELQVQ